MRVPSTAMGNTNDGPAVPISAHPTATIGRGKRRSGTTVMPVSNTPPVKTLPENKLATIPVLQVNSNLAVMSPTRKTIVQNSSSVISLQTTNTTELVNHYASDTPLDINKLKSVSDPSIPGPTTSIGLLDGKTIRVERVVEDFAVPDIGDVSPFSSYSNNLYIYPESLNLGSLSARNIAIQACLLDKDDDVNNIMNNINAVALPVRWKSF